MQQIEDSVAGYPFDKDYINIDVIMRSGQCFGITQDKENSNKYVVLSKDKACCVISSDTSTELWLPIGEVFYWMDYFQTDAGYHGIIQSLLQHPNKFIQKCAEYSRGLVILQQDLWETIVSFIVSQRKSIPAIKSSLEKLRRTFGQRCEVHLPDDSIIEYYTFPSPQDILYHEVTADDINKACGVGYRAEYILDAARWFLDYEYHTLDLGNSYEEHLSALKEIKGVGDKVANCICLFSLGDLNSFPIDVWIQRALDKELFTLEEVDDLEYRGFIQQVIFFYIINHKEEFV